MIGNEMSCREIVDLVTEYLEDALSQRERTRFEEHIAGCDGCDRTVEQYRLTIRLTGRLTEDQLSAPVRDALLEAFRGWKRVRDL